MRREIGGSWSSTSLWGDAALATRPNELGSIRAPAPRDRVGHPIRRRRPRRSARRADFIHIYNELTHWSEPLASCSPLSALDTNFVSSSLRPLPLAQSFDEHRPCTN